MLSSDGFEVFLFVEGRVVPDDGRVRPQLLAEHITRPSVDKISVGRSLKQHRGQKIFATTRRDQVRSGVMLSRVLAVDFLPSRAPAMTTADLGNKAGFINVNDVL